MSWPNEVSRQQQAKMRCHTLVFLSVSLWLRLLQAAVAIKRTLFFPVGFSGATTIGIAMKDSVGPAADRGIQLGGGLNCGENSKERHPGSQKGLTLRIIERKKQRHDHARDRTTSRCGSFPRGLGKHAKIEESWVGLGSQRLGGVKEVECLVLRYQLLREERHCRV